MAAILQLWSKVTFDRIRDGVYSLIVTQNKPNFLTTKRRYQYQIPLPWFFKLICHKMPNHVPRIHVKWLRSFVVFGSVIRWSNKFDIGNITYDSVVRYHTYTHHLYVHSTNLYQQHSVDGRKIVIISLTLLVYTLTVITSWIRNGKDIFLKGAFTYTTRYGLDYLYMT